ncbi:hypothetical protein DSO57_1004021 [Entomophthora muscae]|uniref:Uncharacterized protein n=1 Tax=Entomophthora muscae TaxID=34485 RepID=A0ACC2T863_9FUNG|nr:hypothetical protein DSO57_1004021 [Entomophthora muscae]
MPGHGPLYPVTFYANYANHLDKQLFCPPCFEEAQRLDSKDFSDVKGGIIWAETQQGSIKVGKYYLQVAQLVRLDPVVLSGVHIINFIDHAWDVLEWSTSSLNVNCGEVDILVLDTLSSTRELTAAYANL